MSKVFIIVNAEVNSGKISPTAPIAIKMVAGLTRAIQNSDDSMGIEIIGAADLWSKSISLTTESQKLIYCPLTINLPHWLNFSAKKIFELCLDIKGRRNWVENNFNYKTTIGNSSLGDLWLPLILTQKELVYGEIIGEGEIPNFYQQSIHFPNNIRRSLYKLGANLLESIEAIPAVYLLQFKMLDENIIFDRLWPFPASPAIASLNKKNNDLFACHWLCLTGKSTTDSIM